jgi:F-type H+-transporting ATPase subunit delta
MRADEGIIARRYARAAMLYCDAHGGHEAFLAGLDKVLEAFAAAPVFESLLTTPVLRKEKKQELAEGVVKTLAVGPAVSKYLSILVVRGRVEYLAAIRRKFQELLDEKHNRARADVYTAVALDDMMKQRISQGLTKHLGKEVLCSYYVDEGLYGGVRARVGNRVIDSSIRGKLEAIRHRITALTS